MIRSTLTATSETGSCAHKFPNKPSQHRPYLLASWPWLAPASFRQPASLRNIALSRRQHAYPHTTPSQAIPTRHSAPSHGKRPTADLCIDLRPHNSPPLILAPTPLLATQDETSDRVTYTSGFSPNPVDCASHLASHTDNGLAARATSRRPPVPCIHPQFASSSALPARPPSRAEIVIGACSCLSLSSDGIRWDETQGEA